MSFKFIKATLTLSGMIIGAGMFGIPFSFARAGFWLGTLELIVLSGLMLIFHLFYAEIVLRTSGIHRMPGYMREHLGKKSYRLSWLSSVFGISGSLLAYIILGAIFLNNLLPANQFLWAVFLVLAGAVITYFPLKKESFINSILAVFLVGFILYLVITLLPDIKTFNLSGFYPDSIFVPYGILLFSLAGGIVIPEVVILSDKNRKTTHRAVVAGSLLPAVLYFLFALAVVGISGVAVSSDAIRGLAVFAGDRVVFWGNIIGLLAVFTSLVATSKNFQEMLRLDFIFSKRKAWVLVSTLPLILYTFGFRNFIGTIGAVGVLAVGVDSALVLAAHYKLRKKEGERLGFWSYVWRAAIYLMVILGIVYEVLNF
ncbi:MAG: aromatic amino acid transport family protein [bacterium]|nr:aromatic amino acid transport family protein [bacterium]